MGDGSIICIDMCTQGDSGPARLVEKVMFRGGGESQSDKGGLPAYSIRFLAN